MCVLVVVADPAKLLAASVGRQHLVGVVGGVPELGLEQQHHLQRDVEALVHPWYQWPEEEEWEVHWQTVCEACSFGNLDCWLPELSLQYNKDNFQHQ